MNLIHQLDQVLFTKQPVQTHRATYVTQGAHPAWQDCVQFLLPFWNGRGLGALPLHARGCNTELRSGIGAQDLETRL